MILLPEYKGKKVAVLGLGKAGMAAVESLRASGASVFSWDDNSKPTRKNQKPDDWDWDNLSALIMSPGIPLTHKVAIRAKAENIPIIGEVELLYQAQKDATFVGITGTNGKSTTTSLIAHILEENGKSVQVGGNLGTPALALEPLEKNEIYVIEMSSYQLDLCHSVRFNIACHLNLSPDHLERHGDMAGYIKAKKRIFDNQQLGDIAVVGIDDNDSANIANELVSRKTASVIQVTVKQDKYSIDTDETQLGSVRYIGEHSTEQQNKINQSSLNFNNAPALQGEHNHQNAYVAQEVCRALGISDNDIQKSIDSFGGLEHRMEWLGTKNNINYVNDSKATNADSTAKALATYDNIFWLVGGMAKDGGIESLDDYFPKIQKAYIYGRDSQIFANTLDDSKVEYQIFATLKEATSQAKLDAKDFEPIIDGSIGNINNNQAVILLSPAAASWDQFKSFEHRGEAFRQLTPFNNKQQNKKNKLKDKQRVSIATGKTLDREDSIKLVCSPDGDIIVDINEKLNVKSVWIEANSDKITEVVNNGELAKAFDIKENATIKIDAEKIISQTENAITKRLMNWLSMAIRSGKLVSGFSKVESSIKSGEAVLLLQANDGAADGVSKISLLAKALGVKEYRTLSKEQLSEVVNRANVVHIILHKDAIIEEIEKEIHRLTGFIKNNRL